MMARLRKIKLTVVKKFIQKCVTNLDKLDLVTFFFKFNSIFATVTGAKETTNFTNVQKRL